MKDSWFVSDLHLGHDNIIQYGKRPFANIDEMNEALIENWNRVVKPGDDVYFLGDFSYKSRENTLALRQRLNGTVFFIEGNHDKAAHQIRDTFAWYKEVHKARVCGKDIFLSHYAHRVWNQSHHGVWHLYGHSHGSLPDDPNSLSFDAGIDNTAIRLMGSPLYGTGELPDSGLNAKDYRPLHFDEVAEVMSKKTFKPMDHHGK